MRVHSAQAWCVLSCTWSGTKSRRCNASLNLARHDDRRTDLDLMNDLPCTSSPDRWAPRLLFLLMPIYFTRYRRAAQLRGLLSAHLFHLPRYLGSSHNGMRCALSSVWNGGWSPTKQRVWWIRLHCTALQHGRKRRLRGEGFFVCFAFFLSHSGLFCSRNVGMMDVCFALWVDHTALYG